MLRKTCIRLSLSTYTGMDHFEDMDLRELGEVAEDVKGALDKK